MIVNIYRGEVRDVYPQYKTVADAAGRFPPGMQLVDAPAYVGLGWTHSDDGGWSKPTMRGCEYDISDGCFYTHEDYRRVLHSRTDADVLEAQRKIREGDEMIDWQAWLDALDTYNKAVSDTKFQETYPDKVTYPEYPTKPTA